jgi:hypothetical protein
MLRRLIVVGFAVVVIAGCGSSSPTAAPSASPADVPTPAPTTAPTEEPVVEPTAATQTTMTAICNAIGVRKLPSSTGALIVRIGLGAEIRVVEVVPGDSYEAGACGSAGDIWLKIDQVDGKSVKTLYGVSVAYTAAGFFR